MLKRYFIAIILLLTLSLASGAWGETYYVATGGNGSAPTTDPTTNAYATAYGTIQAAFDGEDLDPATGDIVEVCDPDGSGETYAEKVTWGANDAGDATAQIILRGRTGDTITIDGAGQTECIYIDGIDYVTVTNLAVANAAINIECNGDTDGIQCTYITSSGSTLADFWQDASSADLVLDHWTITQGADYTIALLGGSGTEIVNATISNCDFNGVAAQTHNYGCYLRYINGITISGNTWDDWTLNNAPSDRLHYFANILGTATVTNNTITNCEGCAFDFDTPPTVVMSGNTVSGNQGTCLEISNITTLTSTNDTFGNTGAFPTVDFVAGGGTHTFTDLVITGSGGDGVFCAASLPAVDITFSGGSITSVTGDGIDVRDGALTVGGGMTITSAGAVGIAVAATADSCALNANVSLSGTNGVTIANGPTLTMTGGTYNSNGSSGVSTSTTAAVDIDDITANGNGGGIQFSGLNGTIDNSIFSNNTPGNGVYFTGTGTVTCTGVQANSNGEDGFNANSAGTLNCVRCLAHDNGDVAGGSSGDGFTAHSTGTMNVVNCVGYNNFKSGAAMTESSTGTIYNCTFYNNYEASQAGNYGIWINCGAGAGWTIKNNLCDQNEHDIYISGTAVAAAITIDSDHNDFVGGRAGNNFFWNGTASATLAAYILDAADDSYTIEANSLSVDPLFMGAANNDFRLKAGSPCRDAGTNDYDGDGFDDIR